MKSGVAATVVLSLVAAGAVSSCWVPPWSPLEGELCDVTQARDCAAGFTCVSGRCIENARATQCQGTPYQCGARECLSDPCLPDGGCAAPTPLTGEFCGAGRCRNDGVCVSLGAEFNCTDGMDDNGNGLADCQDPSCLGVGCSTNRCATEICQSNGVCAGPPVICAPPPLCRWPAGCDPAIGCLYDVDAGAACDDGNPCTADSCDNLGNCTGAPTVTGPVCVDGGVCSSGACVAFAYAPSNFAPSAVIAAQGVGGAVNLTCNATFNSTSNTFSNWCGPQPNAGTVTQNGSIVASVLTMASLAISSTGSLTLIGTRPVILAVWGDAGVAGNILANSNDVQVGAGSHPDGGSGCPTPVAGSASATQGGGGGGGGYGGDGGTGGATSGPLGGAGMVVQGSSAIMPLRGGCAGAVGGGQSAGSPGGFGGQGGGAVQLSVAGSLTISGTGAISASGRGGGGGGKSVSIPESAGGGGGGSGGAILLEGNNVSVASGAALTANGGGGGGGGAHPNADGLNAANGSTANSTPAAEGAGGDINAGAGGKGGAGVTAAQSGQTSTDSGGGGGGGVGRIRVNNGTGTCNINATVMSPPVSKGPGCP